jgi:hypothetical protein
MASYDAFGIYFAIICVSLIVYALSSAAIHFYKLKYIHESGIAIGLGILLSYLVSLSHTE